jgi:hypothetical protein
MLTTREGLGFLWQPDPNQSLREEQSLISKSLREEQSLISKSLREKQSLISKSLREEQSLISKSLREEQSLISKSLREEQSLISKSILSWNDYLKHKSHKLNCNADNVHSVFTNIAIKYLYGWTVHFEINWLFITNKCTYVNLI